MLLASVTAGLAFSTAGLGAVHGIGHAVGAVSGLGHGLVNAILLPYVIDFNSAAVRPLLKRLENEAGGKIADRIRRMNKKFGIPARLSLARPGLNEKSGLVIESLSYSGSMAYNPVKMDRKKAEKLLMEAL